VGLATVLRGGPMERTNNKIKTMKRQAYGFRVLGFSKPRILAIHDAESTLVGEIVSALVHNNFR
jgi:hypothetical protein